MPFGEVLNRAAARAEGEVLLKMDDDDWYGPDFVADLLLARGYSGADVVGCSAEFTFLQELGVTTRQALPTEVYRPLVAGGTIMVDRGAFDAVGGFRHTVEVRGRGPARSGPGLRWQHLPDPRPRLRPEAGRSGPHVGPGRGLLPDRRASCEQWRGFQPSRLLRADEADLPAGR